MTLNLDNEFLSSVAVKEEYQVPSINIQVEQNNVSSDYYDELNEKILKNENRYLTEPSPVNDGDLDKQLMPSENFISEASKRQIEYILELISSLTSVEKLLLYLRLPTNDTSLISQRTSFSNRMNKVKNIPSLFQSEHQNPYHPPTSSTLLNSSTLLQIGSRLEICQTINWISTHLVEDSDLSLPKQDVYDEYTNFCVANDMKPLSTANFGKVMKQVYPSVRPRRLGTRGNSRYCYAGLRKRIKLETPMLPEINEKPLSSDVDYDSSAAASNDIILGAQLIVLEWAETIFLKKFYSIKELAYHLLSVLNFETTKSFAQKILKSCKNLFDQKSLEENSKLIKDKEDLDYELEKVPIETPVKRKSSLCDKKLKNSQFVSGKCYSKNRNKLIKTTDNVIQESNVDSSNQTCLADDPKEVLFKNSQLLKKRTNDLNKNKIMTENFNFKNDNAISQISVCDNKTKLLLIDKINNQKCLKNNTEQQNSNEILKIIDNVENSVEKLSMTVSKKSFETKLNTKLPIPKLPYLKKIDCKKQKKQQHKLIKPKLVQSNIKVSSPFDKQCNKHLSSTNLQYNISNISLTSNIYNINQLKQSENCCDTSSNLNFNKKFDSLEPEMVGYFKSSKGDNCSGDLMHAGNNQIFNGNEQIDLNKLSDNSNIGDLVKDKEKLTHLRALLERNLVSNKFKQKNIKLLELINKAGNNGTPISPKTRSINFGFLPISPNMTGTNKCNDFNQLNVRNDSISNITEKTVGAKIDFDEFLMPSNNLRKSSKLPFSAPPSPTPYPMKNVKHGNLLDEKTNNNFQSTKFVNKSNAIEKKVDYTFIENKSICDIDNVKQTQIGKEGNEMTSADALLSLEVSNFFLNDLSNYEENTHRSQSVPIKQKKINFDNLPMFKEIDGHVVASSSTSSQQQHEVQLNYIENQNNIKSNEQQMFNDHFYNNLKEQNFYPLEMLDKNYNKPLADHMSNYYYNSNVTSANVSACSSVNPTPIPNEYNDFTPLPSISTDTATNNQMNELINMLENDVIDNSLDTNYNDISPSLDNSNLDSISFDNEINFDCRNSRNVFRSNSVDFSNYLVSDQNDTLAVNYRSVPSTPLSYDNNMFFSSFNN